MKTKSPKNFNEFIQYWNDWHKTWWNYNSSGTICEWPEPFNIYGNKESGILSINYFPEPYYYRFPTLMVSNCDTNFPIDAIFLSINPGGADSIDFKNNSTSALISDYNKLSNNYSLCLNKLLAHKSGKDSTNSFVEHREKRTKELLNRAKDSNDVRILCADLVPWHTKNQSEISKYIVDNAENILNYILIPLARIANINIDSKSKLHGKIFIRGVSFRDVINAISQTFLTSDKYEKRKSEIKYYSIFEEEQVFIKRFSSILTVIKALGCTFYIFTGGQGMKFPPLNKKVALLNSKEEIKTLKELLLE